MKKPAANIKYRILSVLSVITVLFIWELVTDILHLISQYLVSDLYCILLYDYFSHQFFPYKIPH